MKIVSKNNLITKSNSLIEARYKLSLEEQRVILFLVSMVQPIDEDFKTYTILVKDFVQLVNVKNQSIYRNFVDISESLTSKTISIKKDTSTLVMSWLSSSEYFDKQGKIELSFDPKLKPYLLRLKDNFTTYRLENVIKMKSFYSIRIYELLKQYEKLHERTFSLAQLRDYLSIGQNQYPLYANFKQKVLNVAKKELREKSDLSFEFEEIKLSRKIEKIRFIIFSHGVDGEEAAAENKEELSVKLLSDVHKISAMIKENLTRKEVLSIIAAADGDLKRIEKCYAYAKSKNSLDNIVGFMIWACKQKDNNFENIAASKFNNFEQNDWDFDKLKLLEERYVENKLRH